MIKTRYIRLPDQLNCGKYKPEEMRTVLEELVKVVR